MRGGSQWDCAFINWSCCFLQSQSAVNTVDSWSGFQSDARAVAANDPLVEQINIIKSYIKQARQAFRIEEVEILEQNLRELQQEFYNRQQQLGGD